MKKHFNRIYGSHLLLLIIGFCLIQIQTHGQKFATKLIPLNDSSIALFTDVNELYFLYDRHNVALKKLVEKLAKAKNQEIANKLILKIAKLRSDKSAVVLSLDYFFKIKKPISGSNVERVVNFLANSNHYQLINQYYLNSKVEKDLPTAEFEKQIQAAMGWEYGNGAFYFLSKEDEMYIERMKQVYLEDIDWKVEQIIEKYLTEQTAIFKYDAESILQEILQIPHVKDAQWDRCLIKLSNLPNWDQVGILICDGKDTVERVYSIQYSKSLAIKLGKRFYFPIYNNSSLLWYKGAEYGLHFIENTRKQCEENERNRQSGN